MKTALSDTRHLISAAVSTTSIMLARITLQGLALILLSRLLSPTDYGMLGVTTVAGVALGLIASIGAPYVFLRAASDNPAKITEIWCNIFYSTLSIGIMIVALSFITIKFVGRYLELPTIEIMIIIIVEVIIIPLSNTILSAFQAIGKVSLAQIYHLIYSFSRIAAVTMCFFIKTNHPLIYYCLLLALASIIYFLTLLKIGQNQFSLNWGPFHIFNGISQFGIKNMIMHLTSSFSSDSDKLVALAVHSPHEVGLYTAASRVFGVATSPVTALLLNAYPHLFKARNKLGNTNYYMIVGAGTFVIGLSGSAILLIFGYQIFSLLGEEYLRGINYLNLLALSLPVLSIRHFLGTILISKEKPIIRMAIELLGTLTLVVAALITKGYYPHAAVPSALIISESLMAALFLLILIRPHLLSRRR